MPTGKRGWRKKTDNRNWRQKQDKRFLPVEINFREFMAVVQDKAYRGRKGLAIASVIEEDRKRGVRPRIRGRAQSGLD